MTSALSKYELKTIIDIMHQSLSARDDKNIIALVERIYDIANFKAVAIGLLNHSKHPTYVSHWITSGYSNEWLEIYRHNKYDKVDPILHYGMQTDLPFTWAAARKSGCIQGKGVSELLRIAKAFGVYNGIAIICPSREITHSDTVIAIETQKETIPVNCFQTLQLISPHVHEALNRSIPHHPERKNIVNILSHREIEVLKWAKEGKSSWEIGRILNISERTVKFHFSNIFKKLNVVNRSQAVAKGIRHGLT